MGRVLTMIAFSLISVVLTVGQNPVVSTYAGTPQPATVKSKPDVKLPTEARKTGIGGNVTVRVSVDVAGNVISVHDISGPGSVCRQVDREDVRAIRESAHRAALATQFEPARANGIPVASTASVTFSFKGEKNNTENALINGLEPPKDPKNDKNYSVVNAPPTDYKGPVAPVNSPYKATAGTEGSSTPESKTISGGVLNGKAAELSRPAYPPAARAVRASGSVPVQVLIDERGEVFLAWAVSGHPLLRPAAITAACASRFMPTLLSGEPVKVSGIITYNFVP